MIKLKDCPFCGEKAYVYIKKQNKNVKFWQYQCGCNEEKCRGYKEYSPVYKTEEEAADAWGRQ